MQFAPDSQSLTFLSSDPAAGSLGLYLVSTVPSEPVVIANGQPFYWDWSPDSAELFVHIGGRLTGSLAFLDLAGGTRDELNL